MQLCNQLETVKLSRAAIGGTKIKANASDSQTYDIRHIEKVIQRCMEKAEAIDQKEDALYGSDKTGDEIPEEIRDPSKRIEKLKGLKKQLVESDQEKINKTDPDAVFMKTSNGIRTSYNAQAATDTGQQVIVASNVPDQASAVSCQTSSLLDVPHNVKGKSHSLFQASIIVIGAPVVQG